jgi:phosphate/sulfate permease
MLKYHVIKAITLLALLGAIVWLARSPDWEEPAVTSLTVLGALIAEEITQHKAIADARTFCDSQHRRAWNRPG